MALDSRARSARIARSRVAIIALLQACSASPRVVEQCEASAAAACRDDAQSSSASRVTARDSGASDEPAPARRAQAAGPRDYGSDSAVVTSSPDAGGADTPTEPDDDAGASNEPSVPARDAAALVGETVPLGVMLGMYAKGHERELYGADLGWTFAHEGRLWVLFGDAWRTEISDLTLFADDALAQISLEVYPNGRSVEDWIRAHPAADGAPAWRAAGPEMQVALTNGMGSSFAPTTIWHGDTQIYTGPGLTPLAGFSNALSGSASAAFGLFFQYAHVECQAGQCADGFECDAALGRELLEPFSPPCVVRSTSATCVAGPGFCQDRSSSMYDASSETGRTKAIVVRHEVGTAVSNDPTRFETQSWATHRFFNLAARSVEDFDPARPYGRENQYQPAAGSAPEHDSVFLWGRPNFTGIGSEGRDAELYFAWLPMPVRDAMGRFDWKPHYYAGSNPDGTPRFVDREVDSTPLDLDAAESGEQPEEPQDVVGQMSISWLPSLRRFVLIYGGDIGEGFSSAIFRADADKVRHDPRGALYVRFAEQPWGPWSTPRPLLTAGDGRRGVEAVDQYAPGGLLHHDSCQGATCAGNDKSQANNNGALYAPSIIEPWTQVRADSVDLFWFLSTWNPYQVVLLKTTLKPGDLAQ
jgi:hypothetical protein